MPRACPLNWVCPVPFRLLPTADADSFLGMPPGTTGLPLPPHPGGFGAQRRWHTHEGVDLYVPDGTPVVAVEDGVVVAVLPFTGAHCIPPTAWWEDTWAVMVEGVSGVVLYGELVPDAGLACGATVGRGQDVGQIKRVLRRDKGRPMAMLHLELYEAGTRAFVEWAPGAPVPPELRDPTPALIVAVEA